MYTITELEYKDLDSIEALELLCFSCPWSRQAFEDELNNPLATYLVVRESNNIIAYGGVWIIAGEGHITNIAVHPDFRRQGIAAMVLKRLFEMARQNRLELLTLEVRKNNLAARGLYEKHGFIKVGERRGYYSLPNDDAVLMTLLL